MLTTAASRIGRIAVHPRQEGNREMKHSWLRRRLLAAVLAVAAMTLGVTAVPGTTALEGAIDLTVDIESKPPVVAPAGAGVIYRITARNVGLPHLGLGSTKATVTGTLPSDFTLLGAGGCTVTGSSYSCIVTAFPQSFDIRMTTASTPASYSRTATADITSVGVTEPVEFTSNNHDEVVTAVEPLTPEAESEAFVCGGCSLTFSDPDVGDVTILVPQQQRQDPTDPSSPLVPVKGVFVTLRQDDTFTGQPCGTDGEICQTALGIFFDEGEEEYQVEDPWHPIKARYVPKQLPCSGVGADQCAPLGVFNPHAQTAPKRLPSCAGAGIGTNAGTGRAIVAGEYEVCRDASFKAGAKVGHVVLMKSNDPLLPPISLG